LLYGGHLMITVLRSSRPDRLKASSSRLSFLFLVPAQVWDPLPQFPRLALCQASALRLTPAAASGLVHHISTDDALVASLCKHHCWYKLGVFPLM
jgi:hypothetical protein